METKKIIASAVHVYTSLGLVFAFTAALALITSDVKLFFISLWMTIVIDSTDGLLARYVGVKEILPHFDGRRLDDLIDFITYAFLPCVALVVFDVLPPSWEWVAVLPLLASAYGFSQDNAKTDESFVGFPSYWNVVFLYLYVLSPSYWLVIVLLAALSIFVFVPIHYIYPSKTKWLKNISLPLTGLYGVIYGIICIFMHADWIKELTLISLSYPVYYIVVSVMYHRRFWLNSRGYST
ncbi:CDP-alcohol phosphatidyltransferase family protein [Desulfovermiculus halophilus]|jgi:phosphatidylcholine synthase|uniref:CDP-alcohol phosphatidyltransferase family protein n=1 Tax=Desulfovermiculus halophilus TaxID=339722 RepID=UPI0005559639|nr:hypothetical protein [Desulfovermiculus halophilus]